MTTIHFYNYHQTVCMHASPLVACISWHQSLASNKQQHNVNIAGTPQKKKTGLLGSRKSPVVSSAGQQRKPTSTGHSRGCCRGFSVCMSMGSMVSKKQQNPQCQQQHHRHQSTLKLEEQVVWTKSKSDQVHGGGTMLRPRIED